MNIQYYKRHHKDMRQLIEHERDTWKLLGAESWIMQEFILRHGQPFVSQPLPKRFKMRQPKACYRNAYRAMRNNPRLRYAEGYMCDPICPFLFHHGWCVDEENRVIDPTLQELNSSKSRSGGANYFGIIFEKRWIPRGGGCVLAGLHGYKIETWLEFDPGFTAVLAEALEYRSRKGAAVQTG